jgi:hypothetical protein
MFRTKLAKRDAAIHDLTQRLRQFELGHQVPAFSRPHAQDKPRSPSRLHGKKKPVPPSDPSSVSIVKRSKTGGQSRLEFHAMRAPRSERRSGSSRDKSPPSTNYYATHAPAHDEF